MSGSYQKALLVGCVILFVAVIAALEIVVIRKSNEREPAVATLPSVVATIETTTTTVMPIPTTVPVTTTTVRRVVTTTTTEPVVEPAVQGEVVVADATGVSLDDPDMGKWRQIALCEMPGPGGVPSEPWGAHWSFKASKFSGALGIANTSWIGAGGGKYGPTAGHATWQQQIEIARVIRDRYGYSAWGCG